MAYRDLPTITSPVAVSGIRAEHPIPEDQTATIYSQDFIVERASYTALAFSDTNATYTSAYYIGDTSFEDMGDGVWKFTRSWATVPADRTEYGDAAFRYPGYDVTGTSREPFTAGVVVTIELDYFYSTDPSGTSLDDPFSFSQNYLTDDTDPTYTAYLATTELVLDCTLERYAGYIWLKTTRTVPRL